MRAALLVMLVGCTGVSSDPGVSSPFHVQDAQYRPGPFPSDEGGPAVVTVLASGGLYRGGRAGTVRGVLDLDARGVAIGVVGEEGAWIVPAGPADIDSPDNATASAQLALALDFPPGPFALVMAATDRNGRFGSSATGDLVALDPPVPDGELVIGLTWAGAADLDIHVVDPLGGEAYSRDPNTYQDPVPGEPVDPTGYLQGGILDHDGNQACQRNGSPSEHVVWKMPPPSGEYVVRVDARSMCGAVNAAWEVSAYRSGELIGRAVGISVPDDVLQPHSDGAGVLALRFSL